MINIYYPLKDIYLTGFTAELCAITRIDHPGFSNGPGKHFNEKHDWYYQDYHSFLLKAAQEFSKENDIVRHYVNSTLRSVLNLQLDINRYQ